MKERFDCDENIKLVFAGEEQKTAGSFWGPVARCEYILHYVLSGEGYCNCGGKTIKIGEGESFMLFPDELAKYWADSKNPWHYVWINFRGNGADSIVSKTAFTPENRVAPFLPLYTMYPFFKQAVDAYFNESSEMMSAYSHLLLAQYTKLFPSKISNSDDNDPHRIVGEYMASNYTYQGLTVKEIATNCHISRSQLFRICKSDYGCSPIVRLTQLRVEQAKHWLEVTDHPIGSIASSAGFSDAMYFSKIFMRYVGMSPSDYRKASAEQRRKLSPPSSKSKHSD